MYKLGGSVESAELGGESLEHQEETQSSITVIMIVKICIQISAQTIKLWTDIIETLTWENQNLFPSFTIIIFQQENCAMLFIEIVDSLRKNENYSCSLPSYFS